MDGGFDAWNGLESRASVDQGMFLITGEEKPEDVIALAYGLEEGSRRFYRGLADRVGDPETRELFAKLADIEVRHEDRLWQRYQGLGGESRDRDEFENKRVPQALEGGSTPDGVLARLPEAMRGAGDALALAMALETDALDLYLRMAQKCSDQGSREVFHSIAQDEKEHLARLGELLAQRVTRQ